VSAFWHGRRVLVTGHTGFKGAWLTLWLERLGARVTALSLPPEHPDGTYASCAPWAEVTEHFVDLRDHDAVVDTIQQAQPEVTLHLGAQALVGRGYQEPTLTWATNVMGTAHVLEGVRATPSVRAAVIVTSDKVYRNDGRGETFTEQAPLGQSDPYSSSKAAVELLVESWRTSLLEGRPAVATARAGNVIGGGDKAQARLVPDALRALRAGETLAVRFPDAVRPWQHVLEPLHGYLRLAEALHAGHPGTPPAINFGPDLDSCRSVAEVVDELHRLAGAGRWRPDPGRRAEATLLRLDSSLARATLGWRPRLSLTTALEWTVQWHRAEVAGSSLRDLADRQIAEYESLLAVGEE
jgi:CDP-glucose 4,6-dehydratase